LLVSPASVAFGGQLDFPPLPPRGSLDLELVKQSPYFFN
jgi:DNA-directed RNA polymerase